MMTLFIVIEIVSCILRYTHTHTHDKKKLIGFNINSCVVEHGFGKKEREG